MENGVISKYSSYQYSSIKDGTGFGRLHGAKRVITFCLLTVVLPGIFIVLPLYLKHVRYADVVYRVSESDVVQIHDGQSTIFCQKHSLKMNSTFHAFQMKGTPEISNKRKHIRLKKSMSLPDDTLEYWGFYLMRGATVELHGCSRYDGARVLIVKGDKLLDTCGIMNYHNKIDPSMDKNDAHVVVTIESPAEIVLQKQKSKDNSDDNNTASEETSAELGGPDGLERAQLLARDHIHKNQHHIKFTVDKGSLQDKSYEQKTEDLDTNKMDLIKTMTFQKIKRDTGHTPHHLLDQGFNHGGNALNYTNKTQQSAISSFENSLFECYDGNIIISEHLPFNDRCKSVQQIQKTTILNINHTVLLDGYYYYIFFSDNDIVQNDIHTIFDIYKPTFQYENLTESKTCLNKTECEFQVDLMSGELVIVEVPTNDGIEHEEENWFTLTSTCHPRIYTYAVFPVLVLIFILLCSFV